MLSFHQHASQQHSLCIYSGSKLMTKPVICIVNLPLNLSVVMCCEVRKN